VRVLITDGEQTQTLGAVRALGQERVHVVVGSGVRAAVSFFSRYCAERVVYPNPRREGDAFLESIIRTAKERSIDVLLPIGYYANVLFSRHREELCRVANLAIADYDAMAIASDKQQTMAFAQSVGVPTPRVYVSRGEIRTFPVVVKAAKGTGTVSYVNSKAQLESMDLRQAVVQEYIPGSGFGFYGLFNRGELRAFFMHRRIREFPVTGGASTAAAAYYDERLKELGLRLMAGLKWHGVAMVEMKRDRRDEEYKLMEINPKFWGSLDLSIAAGVNFPYLACRMAYDGDVKPALDYNRDVRFRWPFPNDVLHVIAKPSSAKQFLWDFCDPMMKTNLSLEDWAPSLHLILTTPLAIARRAAKGRLFRPHGTPSSN
jgi:predicted ATP-grasp superfamily ATP-dependent carboligase